LSRGTGAFSLESAFAGAAALGPGTAAGLSWAVGLDGVGSATTAAGCCAGGVDAGFRLAVGGCGPGRPAAGGA